VSSKSKVVAVIIPIHLVINVLKAVPLLSWKNWNRSGYKSEVFVKNWSQLKQEMKHQKPAPTCPSSRAGWSWSAGRPSCWSDWPWPESDVHHHQHQNQVSVAPRLHTDTRVGSVPTGATATRAAARALPVASSPCRAEPRRDRSLWHSASPWTLQPNHGYCNRINFSRKPTLFWNKQEAKA